jgi:catechol 2,3-dioxygenase-like lactoylglutathione lyase family enzyme
MLKEKIISGIQQIGIGVKDFRPAWRWYKETFGVDIRIFEDSAVAELMLPYTGGKPRMRHAALAMNIMGGGGFEIWQYVGREPKAPEKRILLGDIGIFAAKIKSNDVQSAYHDFHSKGLSLNGLHTDPNKGHNFFINDPYGNIFQVVESKSWFKFDRNKNTGATYGAIIGVSDIENARKVYSDILGYDQVAYDKEGVFEDFAALPGGSEVYRRVLLRLGKAPRGFLSRFLGPSEIELVQAKERKAVKIFQNRYWGDLGFIHLCFDIQGMDALREECSDKGFPFTVDSDVHPEGNSFDMGEAAGHFSYIEDPDGTLIEFVETHKIPIIKKLGWYIHLRKRDPEKPLPNFILKALKYNKVKDKYLLDG